MNNTIALYIRVSLEDDDIKGEKTESNSVTNQRKLLNSFVSAQDEFAGSQAREFVDDGYTGRNFDRPGFKKLIEACRGKKVSCIIVKDLSRLGRNYVEVGNLMEQIFPFLGVRIISVNDNYDSNSYDGLTGGIDIAFKNLVYNMYSRDISQKVKTAVMTKMKRGECISPYAIFGYRKSKSDIHKLEIDEEAATIVRRIFQMVIDNIPRKTIVQILNEENVPTAALYKKQKGCSRDWYPDGKKSGWNTSMIAKIIRDERYAGHMVSHKKVYEAFDSKHQIDVDKSEWIVVRNTHEGIVTQEEFDMANANMQKSSRGKRVNPANKKNYSVIICPYCGLTLRPGNQRDLYMYCPTGRMHKESKCQEVRIKKSVVEETLVNLVRSQAEMLITAEKILNHRNKGNSDYKNPQSLVLQCKAELTKLETDKVLCYENYKIGKISRNDFKEKKKLLDSRKKELIMSIEELEARVITECKEEKQQNAALEIKKYVHLEKYDKAVMAALITKVEVLDEDTINVVWKYQSEYDKILAVL